MLIESILVKVKSQSMLMVVNSSWLSRGSWSSMWVAVVKGVMVANGSWSLMGHSRQGVKVVNVVNGSRSLRG